MWGDYLGGTRVPLAQLVITDGAGASGDLAGNCAGAMSLVKYPPFSYLLQVDNYPSLRN